MPTTDIAVWVAPDMPTTWRDGLTRAAPRLAWHVVDDIRDADISINRESPTQVVAYYGDWTIELGIDGYDSAWYLAGWLAATVHI